ncbi:Helix-turn-helix domain-containing protein [Streptomyces sp. cf386]|nr:Helix-turn-helix domain-containing protein [Streptomyces sp. cf386]
MARAFGCARVVFNDAVRAREDARRAGQPFPTAGELSRRLITEAKQTAARSWLGEVSAVVLQQSLRDAETAYRNFFASLGGTRKGPKLGAPGSSPARTPGSRSGAPPTLAGTSPVAAV